MGRLGKMLSKAGDMVQQVNEEYQRARQQQQQQQAQQAQQAQGQYAQTQQPYSQYYRGASASQYETPPSNHHTQYLQQQLQQQRQEAGRLQQEAQEQRQEAERLAAQYRAQYQQELQNADRELERLKREQEEAERLAAEQVEADRRAAEKLAAEFQAEHERDLQQSFVEADRLKREQEEQLQQAQCELEKLSLGGTDGMSPPPIPPRPQSGMHYPPPPPPPPGQGAASPESLASGLGQQHQQTPYYSPPPTQASLSPTSTFPPPRKDAEIAVPYFPPPPTYETRPPMTPVISPPFLVDSQPKAQVASTPPPPVTAAQPPPKPVATSGPHPSGVTPADECVGSPVTISLDWFFHSAAPSFSICTRCYVDHIYDTQFRDSFTKSHRDDKTPRRCLFGTARMKDRLWPAAVSSSSLGPVVDFMQKRQNTGTCPNSTPKENERWYTTPDIPGLTFCPACYEDDLLATSFGSQFSLETLAGACFCDFSTWYIRRMFESQSKENDWNAFVEEAKARLQFPPCPKGQAISASQRTWFVSKRGPEGLQVCVACYCDYFHGSPDADAFERTNPGARETMCVMGHLNVLIPMHEALGKEDRSIFWRALEGIDRNPFCSPKGTKGAAWYTLPNDPPEFGVCGGCYAGIVQSVRGAEYFIRKPGAAESDTLLCCFNPGHVRATGYLQRLSDSLITRDWRPMADFALHLGRVPACPKSEMRVGVNRKWWGWDDVQICEECYLTFAKGTALESQYQMHGQFDAGARICDLYSPRMRRLYQEACDTGKLAEFLQFATHRRYVFLETIPVIERMLMQQQFAAMQANMFGIAGTTYKAMGGTVDAVMGHSYTVGNSYVGHGYANEMMLQGAVYDKQSREIAAGVSSPMNVFNVGILEQRWRAVE